MATPLLTQARQAVWAAINAWSPLAAPVINKQWRYEDKPGFDPQVTAGDLPSLKILPAPGSADTQWVAVQSQALKYPLQFILVTQDWQVLDAENIWEQIVRALYSYFQNGTVVLASGNRFRILNFTPLARAVGQLGGDGPVATEWTFTVNFQIDFWDPLTGAA